MAHNLVTGSERRRHPRIAKKLSVKLKGGLFDLAAETQNISSSGLYCQVDKYIKPMTKIGLVMLIPVRHKNNKLATKKIRCGGVVVRADKPKDQCGRFNTALFFSDISEVDKNYISRYVESHLTVNPPASI